MQETREQFSVNEADISREIQEASFLFQDGKITEARKKYKSIKKLVSDQIQILVEKEIASEKQKYPLGEYHKHLPIEKLPAGLLAYWLIKGKIVKDVMKKQKILTQKNNKMRKGKYSGKVAFFNHTESGINFSNSLSLNQFTIEAWVMPIRISDQYPMLRLESGRQELDACLNDSYGNAIIQIAPVNLSKNKDGNSLIAGLWWSNKTRKFTFSVIKRQAHVRSCAVEEGKYYHVVGTWNKDKQELKLYIDGKINIDESRANAEELIEDRVGDQDVNFKTVIEDPKDMEEFSGRVGIYPLSIGSAPEVYSREVLRTWNGYIEMIRIYDRCLHQEQILKLSANQPLSLESETHEINPRMRFEKGL